MQAVIDALRATPTLRALVCSIEMPTNVLLDRQLARLSGIDLTTILHRRLDGSHAECLDWAMGQLATLGDRLAFVRPPFHLENVFASAKAFSADLVLCDYIQRIPPAGHTGDRRGAVDASMNHLREFASDRHAVIVVSAVARAKDRSGRSSYAGDGLNLASFRESSELEFGADDAFILVPGDADKQGRIILRHLKARHGAANDVALLFDRCHQSFEAVAGNDK